MSDYRVRAVLEYYDKGFAAGMKSATSALNNAESASSTLGSKIKSGLGFGALMAIGQKAVNTVSNAIRNNLGSAVKRLDTLNNFPKIMKNLGYSADDAQSAINKMSKGIDGLPTALDDIAGATQKIVPLTKSLSKSRKEVGKLIVGIRIGRVFLHRVAHTKNGRVMSKFRIGDTDAFVFGNIEVDVLKHLLTLASRAES